MAEEEGVTRGLVAVPVPLVVVEEVGETVIEGVDEMVLHTLEDKVSVMVPVAEFEGVGDMGVMYGKGILEEGVDVIEEESVPLGERVPLSEGLTDREDEIEEIKLTLLKPVKEATDTEAEFEELPVPVGWEVEEAVL